MKLVNSTRSYFDYDPDRVKMSANGAPFFPGFDPHLLEKVVGSVYSHNPRYKDIHPKRIYLTMGDGTEDPGVLVAKFRAEPHLLALTLNFTITGSDPIRAWDRLLPLLEALRGVGTQTPALLNPSCRILVSTDGAHLTTQKARTLLLLNCNVQFNHDGPLGDQSILDRASESFKALCILAENDKLVINSVEVPDHVALMNYFCSMFPKEPIYKGFGYIPMHPAEEPLKDMWGHRQQYMMGVAERFIDFRVMKQGLLYRLNVQDYAITQSYNRGRGVALNIDTAYIDLKGWLYNNINFQRDENCTDCIGCTAMTPIPDHHFFVGNQDLREHCAGCPVLPLCRGGSMDVFVNWDNHCLSNFVFLAPLWFQIMTTHIMHSANDALKIKDADFLHKDLLIDFLDGDMFADYRNSGK